MKNTKKQSIFQFLIIPSLTKKGWYTALCFELGLMREGKDFMKLKMQISKLAFNYYRSVVENNLSDKLLNQSLPRKYIILLKRIKEEIEKEKRRREWEEILKRELWKLKAERDKKSPSLIGLGV